MEKRAGLKRDRRAVKWWALPGPGEVNARGLCRGVVQPEARPTASGLRGGQCDRRKHTQTHHCGGFVLPSRFHVCCSRCRWHSPHETCREKKAAGVGEEEKREGVRSCSEEAAAAAPLSSPRRSRFRNSGSPSLRCRRSSGGRATPMLHEHQRDDQHCVTYLHVICLVPQLQLQLRTAIR